MALRKEKMEVVFDKFSGEIAEVGVYKGDSAEKLVTCFPDKRIHLFDTFTGIPDILSPYDSNYKVGDHNETSLELVQQRFKDKNVQVYRGLFPASAEGIKNRRFCLVNIDVDIYQSTKDCWEFFYPRMIPGGVIIVYDDYFILSGAKKATDDFLKDKPEPLQEEGNAVYMVKQ